MISTGTPRGRRPVPLVRDLKMMCKVELMRFVSREYDRANPDKIFLFGDNLERRGSGRQAAAMRGKLNAIGLPTKERHQLFERGFFHRRRVREERVRD